MNLGSGAEFGVYTKNDFNILGWNIKSPHWNVVDFELPMTLNLYNYYGENHVETIFNWAPYEKQWWITGFNPEFMQPDVKDMVSIGSIDFSGHKDLYKNLNTAVKDYEEISQYMIFDEDGHTVWINWSIN